MGCYIWYSEEGTGRAGAPPSPVLAVPNVTAHPSTASVPITVLLCGINVTIKELIRVDLYRLSHSVSCVTSEARLSALRVSPRR